MAGRMGGNRQSVFRLEVANINKEGGILMVKGSFQEISAINWKL